MNSRQKIIEEITGSSEKQLFLNPKIPKKYEYKLQKAFGRLSAGEPLEYIINKAEFFGLDFFVDTRVLIPRNATEIIVEKVLKEISYKSLKDIILIDVGTGSSCIPISIIKNTAKIKKCFVIDISKKALKVSKINIQKYDLEHKIIQIYGNLLNTFKGDISMIGLNGGMVIITANLPYIKQNDHENMDISVIKYEPNIALYGGKCTGFELYEKLITQCISFKKEKNIMYMNLFIEIGFDQYDISKQFFEKLGMKYQYSQDIHGIYRCVEIQI